MRHYASLMYIKSMSTFKVLVLLVLLLLLSHFSRVRLRDPIDGSPPGSPIPGILQARTLEWVAISFSNAWKWKVKVKSLSRARLFATPWTAAYQASPSMGFSRQEYWSGVSSPSPTTSLVYYKNNSVTARWKRYRGQDTWKGYWASMFSAHYSPTIATCSQTQRLSSTVYSVLL